MNAPFYPPLSNVLWLDLADSNEVRRVESLIAAHPLGSAFHRPAWLCSAAAGTGNRVHALALERGGRITAYLPLIEVHSPFFGRALVSSGFGVGGGILCEDTRQGEALVAAAEEVAIRRSCAAIELRGGYLPAKRPGWLTRTQAHAGFVRDLAGDDEAQLLEIPRKQRAEVRKGLANDLAVRIGRDEEDRRDHYRVYSQSVRNLGTPVFPRALFDQVLEGFGDQADILTITHRGECVASVLSLYHKGAVMPYWGGGTHAARHLRANDRMYFELMLHARSRGCTRFDFGRSKTGSGAFDFKRNWGFDPEPMAYAVWTAPGQTPRDADPTSARHARMIGLWKRLPLGLANLVGPQIARGLG